MKPPGCSGVFASRPAFWIALDEAAGLLGGVRVEARVLDRLGVGEALVLAHVADDDRPGRPRAELVLRRVLAEPVEVVAGQRRAARQHPVDVELGRGQHVVGPELWCLVVADQAGLELGQHRLDRAALVVHPAHAPWPAVQVTVAQPRHHHPAGQVDLLGPGPDQRPRVAVAADEHDAAVLHGHGARPGDVMGHEVPALRVEQYLPVEQDGVGLALGWGRVGERARGRGHRQARRQRDETPPPQRRTASFTHGCLPPVAGSA